MPHVDWTEFKNGMMQHIQTSKQKQRKTTGSFGGLGLNAFIPLLFQICHLISLDD